MCDSAYRSPGSDANNHQKMPPPGKAAFNAVACLLAVSYTSPLMPPVNSLNFCSKKLCANSQISPPTCYARLS